MEFQQVSDAQFRALITAVGQTNSQLAINSGNLISLGNSMQDAKKHRDSIERKVENNITLIKTKSTGSGSGVSSGQVENIIEDFYGDDIALLHNNTTNLGVALQAAKIQRDAIDAKTISNKNEHIDFHNKFTTIGNDMTDLGIALDGKASKDHTHEGTGEDCGWFGEKCFLKNLFPSVPSTAILAVVGIGAFVLLKDKI
tara:strand:- start:21 stop:617 length:597 start_codon:yes stop_codon:yes gene_type:complete